MIQSKQVDLIENFLMNGGPPPPETRAHKSDLLEAIRVRDELLVAIRAVLLKTIAQQFVGNSEVRP